MVRQRPLTLTLTPIAIVLSTITTTITAAGVNSELPQGPTQRHRGALHSHGQSATINIAASF